MLLTLAKKKRLFFFKKKILLFNIVDPNEHNPVVVPRGFPPLEEAPRERPPREKGEKKDTFLMCMRVKRRKIYYATAWKIK